MTQVVDGVWRLPVSIVMRSASDGLMYELTEGWQLRRGQARDEQVLLMMPLREVGPRWYSVFNVVPAADLNAAPAPDRLGLIRTSSAELRQLCECKHQWIDDSHMHVIRLLI